MEEYARLIVSGACRGDAYVSVQAGMIYAYFSGFLHQMF